MIFSLVTPLSLSLSVAKQFLARPRISIRLTVGPLAHHTYLKSAFTKLKLYAHLCSTPLPPPLPSPTLSPPPTSWTPFNQSFNRSSYYTIIQAMHEDASSAVWALFLAAAEPVGWFVKSFSLSSCFFFQPEFMFILRRRGLLLRSFFRLVRLFYSTSLPLGCEVHFSFPSFLLFSL